MCDVRQCIGAYPGIGVPTHFFKAILTEAEDGTLSMGAFVLPNEPIPKDTPLQHFQASIDSIECAAGVLLFDRAPHPAQLSESVPLQLPDENFWKRKAKVDAGEPSRARAELPSPEPSSADHRSRL